uniref:Uncharacterized protein n=1 Tax=Glossina morsitans morsitans TaxID=37546 RepID=A0A1B0G679_GLOMM
MFLLKQQVQQLYWPLSQNVPLKYLLKDDGGENGNIAEIIAEWDGNLDKHRDYFSKSTQ